MQEAGDKYDVKVTWLPFLLRPSMPVEGKPKAPDTPSNPRVGAGLRQAGNNVGINFTGKCDRYPNTVLAHRLLHYALKNNGADVQNKLAEVLFRGYFTDGYYPNVENLSALAKEVGLDAEKTKAFLESSEDEALVVQQASEMSASGISGVPFFIVNDKVTFSGAQPVQTFLQVFDQVKFG